MDPVSAEIEAPNKLLLSRISHHREHGSPQQKRRKKAEKQKKAIPFQGYLTELRLVPRGGGKGRYVSSANEAAFCWDPGLTVVFSDGPGYLKELFQAIGITIKHLDLWFGRLEKLPEDQAAALIGLIKCGALNPKIPSSLLTAIGMLEVGAIRAFPGTAADLAHRIQDEDALTEDELNRHFDYESYGSELMRTLERKDIGDLDERELGETWVDELFCGVGNMSVDVRRRHFGLHTFTEEVSKRVIEFTVDSKTWLIEKTLT